MTALALNRSGRRPVWLVFGGLAAAALVLGAFVRGDALEAWYIAFVVLSGLSAGSLGLLMIGHILGEHWLAPVREELEAASLTAPLLLVLALPLGLDLGAVFPWARSGAPGLPPGRQVYFGEAFFLGRSLCYIGAWSAVALWVVTSASPRRASGIGVAILAPTLVFAANDWVMSRDPDWWSSLFGFAFAVNQLLGALAGAILFTLVVDPRTDASRLMSLERALLTLSLLALWIWFSQFLIVWLANLPLEVAWYSRRSGETLALLLYGAGPALLLALVLLVPSGVGRRVMIAGSGLLLVHHLTHMVWIANPTEAATRPWGLGAAAGAVLLWSAWFTIMLRGAVHRANTARQPD